MLHSFDSLSGLAHHLKSLPGTPVFLTDSHCLEQCWPSLAPDFQHVEILEVEPGEASKSIDIASGLWQALLEIGADKSTHLITLGGGVVTDLGGFVASTFKRGIQLSHIPTSVLAMVDAAVGGKTGINLHPVKNQVGTIYMPHSVCLFPGFTYSLPVSELRSGYGEMLKHAFLMGADALDQMAAVELSAEALAPHIAASAQFKLDVAQDDLRDTGKRQMLNLGHSIGHALEGALLEGHTKVSHGWAVAWGMVVESRIASLMDLCEDNANAPLRQAVEGHFPALTLTDNQVAHALTLLAHDKKNVGGEIVMSLPLQPGSIALQKAVPLAVAERALREIMCA